MTVNQELLSNTKPVQEQKGAITLTSFWTTTTRHGQDHTPTTTKGWRFAWMPSWASRHIGGSRQGHPRYTDARKGRPWVQHDPQCDKTCTTKRQASLSLTTYMVAEPCSVQSALKTGSSSEQNKSSNADKKLTDSVWAVASRARS